jgi:energy-coupling factor transport system ATP-binding protein
MVLDEPTTDLDPVGKAEVGALLRELSREGSTAVLVEHETELLAQAGRTLFLQEGRIAAAGPFAEFTATPEQLGGYGIRPPDLSELWRLLGLTGPPAAAEAAHVRLREVGFAADPSRLPSSPAPGEPLFVLENVRFAYPGGLPVLDAVNLEIRRGESVALLGANGAGKTTLVGLLNGLRRPSSGRVQFAGREVAAMTVGELGRRVGYVFQNPDWQIFAANVYDEVEFTLKMRGVPPGERPARIARVLAAVGLEGSEQRDPFMMTKGERQKLALASVLVGEPDVLILDEPTTGLDASEQAAMNRLLRGLQGSGCTLIIVTHSMDAALELCARTVLMGAGRLLADGPTREVFAQPDRLAAASLRAPAAARLSALFGLGALDVRTLAACLRRPA